MNTFEYQTTQTQQQDAAARGFRQGMVVGIIITAIGMSIGMILYLGGA